MREIKSLQDIPSKYNGFFSQVVIIAVLFIGIFMPCLFRIRMQYIIFAVEIIYILWQLLKYQRIKINKNVIKILLSFLPFYSYYVLLVLYGIAVEGKDGMQYMIECKQAVAIAVYAIVLAITLTVYKQSKGIASIYLYKLIIWVGVLQLFFVTISFFSPFIKKIFNSLTIKNSFNETIVAVMNKQWYMTWRSYGLAENTFDGFGFIITFIISITYVYGLCKKKKSLLLLASVMLFMPLLNARTGLVLCLVSLGLILLAYISPKRIVGCIIAIFFISLVFCTLYDQLPFGLRDALTRGVADISSLLHGQKTGVFAEVFGADIVFPTNLFFGEGISPERFGGYFGIDSGYIQCLWRFGLAGTFLLFGGLLNSFYIVYRVNKQKHCRIIIISTIIIIFVYCLKLYPFTSYANIFTIFLLLFVFALDETRVFNKQ